MKIIVHHLNNSRSQRILWLLEEVGAEYEIKLYQRDAKTMLAPPELKAVHPLGKAPVVTVEEGGKTITLAESGAILEYLAGHIPAPNGAVLVPPFNSDSHIQYTYWLHFAEGSAMPPLLLKLIFDKMEQGPLLVRPVLKLASAQVKKLLVTPQIKNQLAFIEATLSKTDWFAGSEFSAADIQMSFPLEAIAARMDILQSHPKIASFLDRIHARAAYKAALKRGGSYSLHY